MAGSILAKTVQCISRFWMSPHRVLPQFVIFCQLSFKKSSDFRNFQDNLGIIRAFKIFNPRCTIVKWLFHFLIAKHTFPFIFSNCHATKKYMSKQKLAGKWVYLPFYAS